MKLNRTQKRPKLCKLHQYEGDGYHSRHMHSITIHHAPYISIQLRACLHVYKKGTVKKQQQLLRGSGWREAGRTHRLPDLCLIFSSHSRL